MGPYDPIMAIITHCKVLARVRPSLYANYKFVGEKPAGGGVHIGYDNYPSSG